MPVRGRRSGDSTGKGFLVSPSLTNEQPSLLVRAGARRCSQRARCSVCRTLTGTSDIDPVLMTVAKDLAPAGPAIVGHCPVSPARTRTNSALRKALGEGSKLGRTSAMRPLPSRRANGQHSVGEVTIRRPTP
jgi:hypothetical protein